jgi:hypothetical protein
MPLSITEFKHNLLQNCNNDNENIDNILLKAYASQNYSYVYIRKDDIISDMIRWLLFNVSDKDWDAMPGFIFFTHDTDALAFKLVWK